MAHSTVYFHHPMSGRMRAAPIGLSWTTLIFGPFPALLRSHWVGAIIILVCAFFTFSLSNLVFFFIYNRWHLRYLINEGYLAKSGSADLDYIAQKLRINIPRSAASA